MNINNSPIINKNPHTKLSNYTLSLLRQEFTIETNSKVTRYGRHNKNNPRKTNAKSMKHFSLLLQILDCVNSTKMVPKRRTYFIINRYKTTRAILRFSHSTLRKSLISASCKYVTDSMRKLAPNIN